MTSKEASSDARNQLAADFRRHLLDNDGELVYWGEAPDISAFTASENGVIASEAKQSHQSVAADKAAALAQLFKEEIGDCHRCPLGDTRIKIVFGVGNPDARVMFIGEGPGFDEDRKGEPFVGKAGQLLDRIMAAIELNRSNAYIANVVKCHPMKNPSQPDMRGNDRPPAPEEMDTCLPFLRKQIDIIRPEIIVLLGATALKGVLGSVGGITSARGRIFQFRLDDGAEIPVLPTFHPAALLRDPELKRAVWEDMKQLRERLQGRTA